jgi:hypothetical protein
MRKHLAGIANSALSVIQPRQFRVLDIGCNDGTLLRCFPVEYDRWGVDPSDIAASIEAPINVISTIFPSSEVKHRLENLKCDVITSIAMFYDLEKPIEFAKEIESLLEDKGIWILEVSYMPLMLLMNSFDTICHEHLEYYSLAILNTVVSRANLRIFRVELNWINGGSIRCYVCKADCFDYDTAEARDLIRRIQVKEFEMQLDSDKPYVEFQERIERLRSTMTELLDHIHASEKTIHIYGASTKGNVLLQWYGIDSYKIPFASDRNSEKVGALTLGTGIKIISEEESRRQRPDYYLVLPWHFKREFLEREHSTILSGTQMIFPLPEITIVNAKNIDAQIAAAEVTEDSLKKILGL